VSISLDQQTAVFGGGCFWCLQAAFSSLIGVKSVSSGYCGGHVANPSYEEVCRGETGHAEVVKIDFMPDGISFQQLLEVFFTLHDPTQLNRQGEDIGTQYRSVIFCQTSQQRQEAEKVIEDFTTQRIWDQPIVTELGGKEEFFPAESYHQNYYQNNESAGYCMAVISPKLQKLRQRHAALLRR